MIVSVVGETRYEANETFSLNLSSLTNASFADSLGVGTIVNDDPIPTISINDVAIAEGNSGTTNAIFTVTLSAISGLSASCNFSTANSTAIAPTDYSSTSGTVIFNAGETSKTISVTINGDLTNEFNESFFVNLTSAGNATFSDSQGAGTILNDDIVPTILSSSFVLALETCAPTNGVIDPGETVTVQIALTNASLGGAVSSNLTATLLATEKILNPSAPQNYGAVSPGGGVVSRPFTFTAMGDCGELITATLQLQDGAQNLGTVAFPIRLGKQAVRFSENFDGVTAPAIPANWTVNWGGAGAPWSTTTQIADTAPNAAFCPDPSTSSTNALTSPSFSITTTNALLSFRHSYSTESCCDRCYLQISVNGGTFQDINTAGGSFLTNGYTSGGWGGSSGGFRTTIARMPVSAAGQSIRLRWYFASDTSVSGVGWYVDSIVVEDGYTCCEPVVVPPALVFQTIHETSPGVLRVLLGTSDGSPVPPNRATNIQFFAATNLSFSNWEQITNPLVLTNGMLELNGLSATNSARFFRAVETP